MAVRAFTCGLQPLVHAAAPSPKVPWNVNGVAPDVPRPAVLWLTAALPGPPGSDPSEVVPMLSWLLGTNHTDTRLLRTPALAAVATGLWLALFDGLTAALPAADPAARASAFDAFSDLFAGYVRMFPCGNCDAQFLSIFRRFQSTKDQLFNRSYVRPIEATLLGKVSSPASRYNPSCSVGWPTRPITPANSTLAPLDPKDALLPPPNTTSRLTVALDIDETLLSARGPAVLLRPGLQGFLDGLRALGCEIIIWTASERNWGIHVVSLFDPLNLIPHRIYRDTSWWNSKSNTKDLRRLGRSMDRVLILENSPYSVWMNKNHAILIPDYFRDDPRDGALGATLHVIAALLASGLPVPAFLPATPLLHRKCPAQQWHPLDEARPYHGIGDFTP